jgi:hypothetical protein
MKRIALLAAAMCLSAHAGPIVKGTRSGGQSLTVSWVLPTTKADGTSLTPDDQQVCYDTVSRQGTTTDYGTCVSVGNGTSTSKVVTGLVSSTTYYFAVKSLLSSVVSNASNEVSATTP